MKSYIPISIKLLSLLGFAFANYFCYLFFQFYLVNTSLIYYFFLVLLSLIILKLDFVLWVYEKVQYKLQSEKKTKNRRGQSFIAILTLVINGILFLLSLIWDLILSLYEKIASYLSVKKIELKNRKRKNQYVLEGIFSILAWIVNIKNLLIMSKIVFFNALYELFSVYIVWASILALFHLVGVYEIELTNPSSFFQISALFALFLGIFQFLLQRHEYKILSKLNSNSKRIEQIVIQETSFYKFYDSIPKVESTEVLRRWIQNTTDPKLRAKDFLLFLLEDNETRKFFFKNIGTTPISINVAYQSSNEKFETLDMEAKLNPTRKKQLHQAYNAFFLDERKVNEIINISFSEINRDDFRLLALSNINIFSEAIPQFTSNNLVQMMDEVLSKKEATEKKVDKKHIFLDSSKEYRQYLYNQVSIEIVREILFKSYDHKTLMDSPSMSLNDFN